MLKGVSKLLKQPHTITTMKGISIVLKQGCSIITINLAEGIKLMTCLGGKKRSTGLGILLTSFIYATIQSRSMHVAVRIPRSVVQRNLPIKATIGE